MHIPDGLLNSNLAGGLIATAAYMAGYCSVRVFRIITLFTGAPAGINGNIGLMSFGLPNDTSRYFNKLAIIAIWVFASQMFNIPIRSATSAHLIGGVFASVLAGPFSGFLVISSVLVIQSLLFADGGILALGANIFNMAFTGSFISYYIYKMVSEKNYYFAVFAACFFSVLAAAFLCLVELEISGTVSFTAAFKDMMSLHLIAALLETVVTLALLRLLRAIYE